MRCVTVRTVGATAAVTAMIVAAVIISVLFVVSRLQVIVTVFTRFELHQPGRDMAALDVGEFPCRLLGAIPVAVAAYPVVLIRVEDLLLDTHHDLDAGLDVGQGWTPGERHVKWRVLASEAEHRNHEQGKCEQ